MPDNQNPVEVFYSYAHTDQRWVKRLDTHLSLLKRQGLISTWYDRQIVSGTNWAKEIDAHINSASLILLLISPDFLASDYCYGIEMKRALERNEAREARVIPIVLRPVDWHDAPFTHLHTLPTDAKPITTWRNKDTAFADVAAGIRRAIEDLTQLAASLPQSDFPSLWNVPLARNPFFIGREDLLTRLHAQLQAGQISALSQGQAISGLGGVGKTQLAVEYAYRYRREYQAVLWVHAEGTEALTSSYTSLAILLTLPEKDAQEPEVIVHAVNLWLQRHQGWLLILDNADEPDILAPFLPQASGGHLLLTTRSATLRHLGIASPLVIDAFPPEQGALFLLRRAGLLAPDASLDEALPEDRSYALQITQDLGSLPLALDQAGAYLEATGSSFAAYQQIYQHHRADLHQQRRGRKDDHPVLVATTWNISFERVEARNPAAADLLRLCAFFAPDAMGEELLTEGGTHLGPVLAPVVADPYLLDRAIETLRAYSLLTRDPHEHTLSMHRLVQAVLRDALTVEAYQQWVQRAVAVVATVFPYGSFDNWGTCERLLPHALLCAMWVEQEHVVVSEAALLLNSTGHYLSERGRYEGVEALHRQALTIREQVEESEENGIASSLTHLGYFYGSQGNYPAAEPLYQRALEIYERVLGPEHPHTQTVLANYADLLQRMKRGGHIPAPIRRATIRRRSRR